MRNYKTNIPSQLNGSRKFGGQITLVKGMKPPKRRFNIGDIFYYDNSNWKIIYMYRMAHEPGVWVHCLEEIRENEKFISKAITALVAGATTPRIVYEPFKYPQDVFTYFKDIYRNGDGINKTTQELLKMKKV